MLVLAPTPQELGQIPGAAEDVERLNEQARAVLISPDPASVAAIGVALAGRAQGVLAADAARAVWRD